MQTYIVQIGDRQERFGILHRGMRHEWLFSDLFRATKDRSITLIPIEELDILDRDIWFGRTNIQPTLRNIASEIVRIDKSDCQFPAIVVEGIGLIDGSHRAVKAYLNGDRYLKCVVIKFKELCEIPHIKKLHS